MKLTWYLTALRRYARFEGRATRLEFWSFGLGAGLVCILVAAVEANVSPQTGRSGPVFVWFVALAHVVPYYAVSVRRLHDAGQTGWLALLNAVPFGSLVVLVLACLPGTPGPNAYGPAPNEHAGEAVGSLPRIRADALPRTAPTAARAPDVSASTMPASAPTPGAARDPVGELERLGQLRVTGVLSEAEFVQLKARLLDAGSSA